MSESVKWFLIPQKRPKGRFSKYDYSIISYKDGNPAKPLIGSNAFSDETYLIKNIKQVMKLSSSIRSNPAYWDKGTADFVYNGKIKLEKFQPDLPTCAFKDLIDELVIGSTKRFFASNGINVNNIKQIDFLIGEPAFPSIVEGMSKRQFRDEYRKNVKNIFHKLGYTNNKIHFFFEPFAIIRYILYKKEIIFKEKTNNILIIDFGGSTFNCCLVRTSSTGRIVKGGKYKNVYGSNLRTWGCSRIDKEILDKINEKYFKYKKLNHKFSNLDHHRAELLKIKLSKAIKKGDYRPKSISIENSEEPINFYFEDFEQIIKQIIWPELEETIKKTLDDSKKELNELEQDIDLIDFVVFAGGGSNLPFLKDLFISSFDELIDKNGIIEIENPELVVAEGLAIEALNRIENTSEVLSDDEFIENDIFIQFSDRNGKLKAKVKPRIISGAGFADNCLLIDHTKIRKDDLVINTLAPDPKPWEVKFSDKELKYKKLDYTLFFEEEFKEEFQFDRSKFDFEYDSPKKYFDLDIYLDTNEFGVVTPRAKRPDGKDAKGKKFNLWSFEPNSKEIIAIDLGNSTTSLYFVSADLKKIETGTSNFSNYNNYLFENLDEEYTYYNLDELENNTKNTESQNLNIEENIIPVNNKKLNNDIEVSESISFSDSNQSTINKTNGNKLVGNINPLEYLSRKYSENNYYSESYISLDELTKQDIINWISGFEKLGYFYDYNLISKILTTLKVGRFPVLYGAPGLGKTKVLELISSKLNSEFIVIPVKPNWRDDSMIISNSNSLTEFQEFVYLSHLAYKENSKNSKYFLICFDEMNLAHPEYYLAELLSVLEFGYNNKLRKIKFLNDKLILPPNLLLSGTINVDHTTKILSPKLKNRVKLIRFEFNTIFLKNILLNNLPDDIIHNETFKLFSHLIFFIQDQLGKIKSGISFRIINFFNLAILKNINSPLFSDEHLYDFLLTSSIIPILEFNKLNNQDEIIINNIYNELFSSDNKDRYSIFFSEFSESFKIIYSEFGNSIFSNGLF